MPRGGHHFPDGISRVLYQVSKIGSHLVDELVATIRFLGQHLFDGVLKEDGDGLSVSSQRGLSGSLA